MGQELDYLKDVAIDLHALEIEWLHQSELFMKYSQASAEASADARDAEEHVKYVRSRLFLEIIEDAIENKEPKPTDKVIEAKYRTHKRHRQAKRDWLDAARKADDLKQSVFGFQQRKAALEHLVTLYGLQYFSGPSNVRAVTREMERDHRETKVALTMKERMKKNKSSRGKK